MNTISLSREGSILVTVLNSKFSGYILSRIDLDLFGYEPAQDVYIRIMRLSRVGKGKLPRMRDFVEDPILDKDAIKLVKAAKPYKNTKQIDAAIADLEIYRKRRVLSEHTAAVVEEMRGKGDTDTILWHMEHAVRESRVKDASLQEVLDFGYNADSAYADSIVKEILSGKTPPVVKTGFRTFDDRSGGFNLGDLVILGASRGSGKTSLMTQMSRNFYGFSAEDTCVIELEMNAGQMMARILAMETGIDSNRIRLRQHLTKKEKRRISQQYSKFKHIGNTTKTRFTVFPVPKATPDSVDMTVGHLGYRVVLIDYINRVKENKGSNQKVHEVIGNIANEFKSIARERNCIVVILVQLTDKGQVKYSRAVEEHADFFWAWELDAQSRALNVANIRQPKARHAEEYSFLLRYDLSTNVWTDYKGKNPFLSSQNSGNKNKSINKRSKYSKIDDGYNDNDTEDM